MRGLKPLATAAAIALLGGRLIWLYIIPSGHSIVTDFPNYYVSAWAVRHGEALKELYNPAWFDVERQKAGIDAPAALFNYFPPMNALILWPLANMPPITAKRLWTIISLIALIGVVRLTSSSSGLSWPVALLLALLGGDALGNNFTYGQFYVVLTLLMFSGLLLARNHPAVAGIASAAGLLTKVFPGFLLAYFLIRREYRTLLWSIAAVGALGILGIVALGWAPHEVYLREVLGRSLRGEIQDPYNVHWNTLQALLRRAFVRDELLNPHPIADLPWLFFFLRPLSTISIVAATFYSIASATKHQQLLSYGALIGMISLITPSQASYHQFLFYPAVAGLIASEATPMKRFLPATLFALICSNMMGATAMLQDGITMPLAFPRVWLVTVLWILFVLALRPQKLRLSPAVIALTVAVVSASSVLAFFDNRRWVADVSDGATLVSVYPAAYLEFQPRFINGRLVTSMLTAEGLRNPLPPGDQSTTSPDGRWTALASNERGNWDIVLRSNETGETRFLTSSSANDLTPVFSPDGRFVYFASDRHRGYRFTTIYRKSVGNDVR